MKVFLLFIIVVIRLYADASGNDESVFRTTLFADFISERNNKDRAWNLLKEQPDLIRSLSDSLADKILYQVLRSNDSISFKRLIDSGIEVDSTSILYSAIEKNARYAFTILMNAGASVNALYLNDGSPAIFAASKLKDPYYYNYLMSKRCDVTRVNKQGQTVLFKCRPEHIQQLIESGADPFKKDNSGNNFLICQADNLLYTNENYLSIIDSLTKPVLDSLVPALFGYVIKKSDIRMLIKIAQCRSEKFNRYVGAYHLEDSSSIGKESSRYSRLAHCLLFGKQKDSQRDSLLSGASNERIAGEYTALELASFMGDTKAIKTLLINKTIKTDLTHMYNAMIDAVKRGDSSTVDALLTSGCNPEITVNNSLGSPEETPLIAACQYNRLPIAALLIAKKADPNKSIRQKYSGTFTPLFRAIRNDNDSLVKLLVENAADVNGPFAHGEMYFCYDCLAPPNENSTALMVAAEQGDTSMIRYLIAKKANVNAVNAIQFSPLMYSVRKDHFDAADLLLQNGADPDIHAHSQYYYKGFTPLHYAVSKGNDSLVRLLLKYKADINILSADSLPPIALAGNRSMITLLLEQGADAGYLEKNKNTLLKNIVTDTTVSINDVYKVLKGKLSSGAMQEETLEAFKTALEKGNFRVLTFLESTGLNVRDALNNDVSLISRAISSENEECVNYLYSKLTNDSTINKYVTAGLESCLSTRSHRMIRVVTKIIKEHELKFSYDGFLFDAVRKGDYLIVKELLKGGANVVLSNKRNSLISVAVASKKILLLKELFLHNAPLGRDSAERCDVFRALGKTNDFKFVTAFLKAASLNSTALDTIKQYVIEDKAYLSSAALTGFGVKFTEEEQFELLKRCVDYGKIDELSVVINAGFSVNAKGKRGDSPLSAMFRNSWGYGNDTIVADYLINHGADSYIKDSSGHSLLCIAAINTDTNAVKFILSRMNRKPDSNCIALIMEKIKYKDEYSQSMADNVALLLKHGANPDAVDAQGNTGFIYLSKSTFYDKVRYAKILLSCKADVNKTDLKGRTPLSWAKATMSQDSEYIDYLLQNGAKETGNDSFWDK